MTDAELLKIPADRRASFHATMETSRTVIAVDTHTGMDDVGIAVATRRGDTVTVLMTEVGAYTNAGLLTRVNELCVKHGTSRVVTAGPWAHRDHP